METNTKQIPNEVRTAHLARVYSNTGNSSLIDLIEAPYQRVLDVGCGAGDNAALIESRNPECEIVGITQSEAEARLARRYMSSCLVADIESETPAALLGQSFDVLIFSHVLEHLRYPSEVLDRFTGLLRTGGQVLIAVPNVLFWQMRSRFLRGDFKYESSGILDDTHLRFFTYFTAEQMLFRNGSMLRVTSKTTSGYFPLPVLRQHVLPQSVSAHIDRWALFHWPNFFGWQILIKAIKD
jgi:2-polyprenyl-3-methyl-5-hydroxy-6-metoxy-1,4-benzoquinol methylase